MKRIILFFLIVLHSQGIYSQIKNILISDLENDELHIYGLLKRAINLTSQDSTNIYFFTHVNIDEDNEYYSMKTFVYDSIRLNYLGEFMGSHSATYSGELRFKKAFKLDPNEVWATSDPTTNRKTKEENKRYRLNITENTNQLSLRNKPPIFSISSNKPFYGAKYEYKVLFKYQGNSNIADSGLYSALSEDSLNNYDNKYLLNTEKYAIIRKKYKCGIVNVNNQVTIPFIYEDIKPTSSDLFFARHDGKCGFINLGNEHVLEFNYDHIRPIKPKLSATKLDKLWAVYDLEKRKFITKFEYTHVTTIKGELIVVRQESQFGAINKEGDIIIPIKYNQIEYDRVSKYYKAFSEDKKVVLYSKEGQINE